MNAWVEALGRWGGEPGWWRRMRTGAVGFPTGALAVGSRGGWDKGTESASGRSQQAVGGTPGVSATGRGGSDEARNISFTSCIV